MLKLIFTIIVTTLLLSAGTVNKNHSPVYNNNLTEQNYTDAQSIELDLSQYFSDKDGDTLTYSATRLPAGISLNNSTGKLSGTLDKNASLNSPYSTKIIAKDPSGLSAEANFTINVVDKIAPQLFLNGDSEVLLNVGDTYKELGVTAIDNADINITSKVKINGTVDTTKAGVYTITYTVTDKDGNVANEVTRRVIVQ